MTAQPTALLADDEPHLLRALESELTQAWPELRIVARAKNGLDALDQLESLAPDVAFLDIKMPGLSGLEVAQRMQVPTRLVFVTAFDAYAIEAFDHAALDYVLKPVQPDRLGRAVARVKQALASAAATPSLQDAWRAGDATLLAALQKLLPLNGSGNQVGQVAAPLRYIRAGMGDVTHQVPVRDVLCFHADDKYTVVHLAHAEHLIRTPLAELAAQLDGDRFVQIHRSTIVNLDHLESTRRDEASRLFVRLRGHAREWPVSRAYVHHFKAM